MGGFGNSSFVPGFSICNSGAFRGGRSAMCLPFFRATNNNAMPAPKADKTPTTSGRGNFCFIPKTFLLTLATMSPAYRLSFLLGHQIVAFNCPDHQYIILL